MNLVLLGVITAVSGNCLIALSLTLQKHVHNKYDSPARSPLFWLALFGMIGGEVGNFAAFGFASPTIVSPLGAVSVIANSVLAVLFLHEALFARTILGLMLTVGGSVVVVLFAPPTIENFDVDEFVDLLRKPPAVTYLASLGGAVLLLLLLEPRFGKRLLLINLLLCSLLGSVTVLCSGAVSKFFTKYADGDSSIASSPVPYILVPILASTAVLQVCFLNRAMASFDSTQVVPVYYITFTLASLSASGVVFQA
jgi:uncharacterized membrane protein